ncbi:hypothetical protein [Burkholderia latens]|uniref:hypothetical protein n=1 Tax=Burkholderia latens TaxID=488446 RepID=UPI001478B18C|nr:hypothetical protein [Burkholderia latens]
MKFINFKYLIEENTIFRMDRVVMATSPFRTLNASVKGGCHDAVGIAARATEHPVA